MSLQIIQDGKGNATGVFIPINQWKKLKQQYKDLEKLEQSEPTKEELIAELKEAFQQLDSIEKGRLKARPANELLNEI